MVRRRFKGGDVVVRVPARVADRYLNARARRVLDEPAKLASGGWLVWELVKLETVQLFLIC